MIDIIKACYIDRSLYCNGRVKYKSLHLFQSRLLIIYVQALHLTKIGVIVFLS